MNTKAKVALITGAGQEIGRAIALRLANDGVDISIVDLKKDKMDTVAEEVQALGSKADVFVADVTPQDVETIFKVNIEGVLWGILAAARKFKARGHKGKSLLHRRLVSGWSGFRLYDRTATNHRWWDCLPLIQLREHGRTHLVRQRTDSGPSDAHLKN